MSQPFVSILMGSDSDLPIMEASFEILRKFNIPFEVKVTSAHRTPKATHDFVTDADKRGCAAFICAAGMAAHLAGAVSATTLKPVIGVPINGSLDGLDSLLSTVQMPGGIPVATVGLDAAYNAGILAGQILSTSDDALHARMVEFKMNMKQKRKT